MRTIDPVGTVPPPRCAFPSSARPCSAGAGQPSIDPSGPDRVVDELKDRGHQQAMTRPITRWQKSHVLDVQRELGRRRSGAQGAGGRNGRDAGRVRGERVAWATELTARPAARLWRDRHRPTRRHTGR